MILDEGQYAHVNLKSENVLFSRQKWEKPVTHSTFLAHSGGLLRVMKAQLVRMVNMINMLNIVETQSRNPAEQQQVK